MPRSGGPAGTGEGVPTRKKRIATGSRLRTNRRTPAERARHSRGHRAAARHELDRPSQRPRARVDLTPRRFPGQLSLARAAKLKTRLLDGEDGCGGTDDGADAGASAPDADGLVGGSLLPRPSETELHTLSSLFRDFDVSGDGIIDLDEFQMVMQTASRVTGRRYRSVPSLELSDTLTPTAPVASISASS